MRLSLNNLVALLVLLVLGTSALAADDPRANARDLAARAEEVVRSVDAASVDSSAAPAVRAGWDAFNDRWLQVEDPIRALSPALYRRIEERMFDVSDALPRKGDWQLADARRALLLLRDACVEVTALPASSVAAPRGLTIPELCEALDAAKRDASAGACDAALARLKDAWFRAESRVSAADRGAYTDCETLLVEARGACLRHDMAGVSAALDKIRARVAPLARGSGHVGALDAALILLREGAEALLVLAAIAAFLGRIGAQDKARTVWLGGALGLLASALAGGALAWAFAGVATGEKREVIEGVSSLIAAALLVVVGQWLHEKIRRGGWKKEVQSAVESGRTLSLLLVAFFAVFREGAETVLFLAGIAPASTPRELALGALLGFAALAVLGVALLALGKRVPVGPFLSFATVLLWALAVKFVGNGVVALQTGGLVSATRFAPIPEVPLVGFAPTLESAGAQLVALLAWAGFTLAPRWRRGQWHRKPELSSIEA